MLPNRRPLPMLLLVLLAGASTLVFAAPQHRARRPAPPPRAQAAQPQEQSAGPVSMPAPRHERREARPRPPRNWRQERRHARNDDALSDSIRRIERNTRGQVLSAERVPYEGRSITRMKVVDERGRVRIYVDDPQRPKVAGTPTHGDDD